VDEFMSDLLLDAGRTGKPISVPALIDRADELSMREFANNPEARAAVLRTVGNLALEMDGPKKALEALDRAQDLISKSKDEGLLAIVTCDREVLHEIIGDTQSADRVMDEIIENAKTPPEILIQCLGDRAQLALYRGDGPTAQAAAARALAAWRAIPGGSPTRGIELRMAEARALGLMEQPGRADTEFAQILEELRRLGRDRGILGYTVREYRIGAAMESGDPRLALRLIGEALAIQEQDMPGRPEPMLMRFERSKAQEQLARYGESLKGFETIVSTRDPALAPRALVESAIILSRLGRPQDAEERFQRAMVVSTGPGNAHPMDELAVAVARVHLDLAARRFDSVRARAAAALADKAIPAPSMAALAMDRAEANMAIGQLDGALQDARLALTTFERLRGDKKYSLKVGQAELILGRVLESRGDMAGARNAYAIAVDQIGHSAGTDHPAWLHAQGLLRKIAV